MATINVDLAEYKELIRFKAKLVEVQTENTKLRRLTKDFDSQQVINDLQVEVMKYESTSLHLRSDIISLVSYCKDIPKWIIKIFMNEWQRKYYYKIIEEYDRRR